MWLGECVVVCVCVCGQQRQIRYAVGDLPLSLMLSVIMGKRMETKRKLLAISHQHIFFNYSSVLSALLGHVFSSCCCPPSTTLLPLALNSCCCCCCSFVFICTGSESLCMAAFCEKKKKIKSRGRWPKPMAEQQQQRIRARPSILVTELIFDFAIT